MGKFTRDEQLFLAYTAAYECMNRSYIGDAEWDLMAISLEDSLKNKIENYSPATGMWIHEIDWKVYNKAYRYIINHTKPRGDERW